MASETEQRQRVHVVIGRNGGWDQPIIVGAFRVKAHAERTRKAANIEHQRIPGTIGSFRVITVEVQG